MFKDFVSKYTVDFNTPDGQNKTRRFDTEDFVPVTSLCDVVGSSY